MPESLVKPFYGDLGLWWGSPSRFRWDSMSAPCTKVRIFQLKISALNHVNPGLLVKVFHHVPFLSPSPLRIWLCKGTVLPYMLCESLLQRHRQMYECRPIHFEIGRVVVGKLLQVLLFHHLSSMSLAELHSLVPLIWRHGVFLLLILISFCIQIFVGWGSKAKPD